LNLFVSVRAVCCQQNSHASWRGELAVAKRCTSFRSAPRFIVVGGAGSCVCIGIVGVAVALAMASSSFVAIGKPNVLSCDTSNGAGTLSSSCDIRGVVWLFVVVHSCRSPVPYASSPARRLSVRAIISLHPLPVRMLCGPSLERVAGGNSR
jgi:hypothetical protein